MSRFVDLEEEEEEEGKEEEGEDRKEEEEDEGDSASEMSRCKMFTKRSGRTPLCTARLVHFFWLHEHASPHSNRTVLLLLLFPSSSFPF
jgi:hypothetical protein